ncbi:hypothetical protein ORFV000115 [Orf virus]|nr:hypothetical protein ORFV000115 [Orf virus]
MAIAATIRKNILMYRRIVFWRLTDATYWLLADSLSASNVLCAILPMSLGVL